MFPNATIPERIADGTVHTIGVLGALTGAIMLLMWASGMVSVGVMIALAIYGIALIATFAASATNNMMPFDGPRPMLRRIDHAACDDDRRLVCLFHPCNRLGLGRDRHHLEAVFWQKPGRYEPALYLVIGWLSVFLIWALVPIVPTQGIWLIAAGGLIYTAGMPIYAAKSMPFSTAIWHGFVVVASACFFATIAVGTAALT